MPRHDESKYPIMISGLVILSWVVGWVAGHSLAATPPEVEASPEVKAWVAANLYPSAKKPGGDATEAKPGEDAAKPGEDTAKPSPGEDTAKPGEDTAKPGEDTAKPGEDTAKPSPGEDTAKPGEDTAKPGEDTAKPTTPAGGDEGTADPGTPSKPVVSSFEPVRFPGVFYVGQQYPSKVDQDAVDEIVEKIRACTGKIIVKGHSDSIGGARENLALSKRRAIAVRRELVKNGVDEKRIREIGMGSREPEGDNAEAAGRRANRRVTVECK